MTAAFPWSLLGIAPTGDARAIRSAYAARIKAMDLDADVEGYARLRDARDTALRMAKTMAQQAEPAPEIPPAPPADAAVEGPIAADEAAPPRVDHCVPRLAGDWPHDPALSTRLPDGGRDNRAPFTPDAFSTPASEATDTDRLVALDGRVLAPLWLEGHADAARNAVDMAVLQSPFERLTAMLHPEGIDISTPFDDESEATALATLDAVLEAIHWSPIARQSQMEHWLADLLAQSWPRSAPLLDKTTLAFGWEQEWGRLDARPTIEYLGARLRGHRFLHKVEQPGHRYHKAWTELHRTDSAGPFHFLRTNAADVRGLLAGIRKNFPELEERFDPQRVASWEKTRVWPTGLIVLGGMIVLGILLSLADPEARAQDEAFKATVAEVFGAGHDPRWLESRQPELAALLAKRMRHGADGDVYRQATIAAGLALVRERVFLDGRMLSGPDFEATMALRLALLEAAQARGGDACPAMMARHAPPDGTPVPPAVRETERRFAAHLVEKGLLTPTPRAPARSATVPPELVRQVMADTGLREDQVAAAMRKDADPNRCAVTIALLRATLDWKGAARHDILMTL